METPTRISEKEKASQEDIQHLRKWLASQPHLPSVSDNMLHLFHHSCYYELNKTKDCIDTYFTLRSNTPEVFKNRNIKDPGFKTTLENTVNFILPKKTPEGYQLTFQRIESTDCSKYNFEQTCKLFFMGLDSFIHRDGLVAGYVLVLDYKHVRLGHLAKTNISTMRKMFKYIQEGSPIRLKSIHMINMNYFIEKVMSFVKPFMHKDLYNLINFYPEGQLEKLQQHIPLSCLPSDYGGIVGTCEELNDQFKKKMEEEVEYFKIEESSFSVNEKLRPKKSKKKKNSSDEICEVSLKSLEID